MKMRFATSMIAALLALLPAAGHAQEQSPLPCAQMDRALPADMAGWTRRVDLVSATGTKDLAKTELALGQAANTTLHRTPGVAYAVQPAKPGGTVSYGGMVSLAVKQAGTYRVALSTPAWIDLVKGGSLVSSTAHGHGPPCSTIRKIVDFPLQPGRYVIQISANADPNVAIMTWRQD